MHPLRPIRAVRELFPRETTVAIDVGCLAQHMAGAHPYFQVFEPRSLIVPSSFYGMGFAAAALPAARLRYGERYIATAFDVQPDFAAIASACGWHGERVADAERVDEAVLRALRANQHGRPAVIDFAVAPERVLGTLEHFTYYPQPAEVEAVR